MTRRCPAPILRPSATGPDGFRPLAEELVPAPRSEEIFRRMCRLPHCLFLDSALHHRTLGRYSFVAADPFEFIRLATAGESQNPGCHGHTCVAMRPTPLTLHNVPTTPLDPAPVLHNANTSAPEQPADALDPLMRRMAGLRTRRLAGLPPFQGGAAGLFGYGLGATLETLPRPRVDEFRVPLLAVGLYDVVVAMDHVETPSMDHLAGPARGRSRPSAPPCPAAARPGSRMARRARRRGGPIAMASGVAAGRSGRPGPAVSGGWTAGA